MAVVAALLLGACGGSDGGDGAEPAVPAPSTGLPSGPPDSGPAGAGPDAIEADVVLTPLVDLDQPTALAARPDGGELWITEQDGTVRRVVRTVEPGGSDRYDLDPDPLLDLGDLTRARGEQGLLGIAFDETADSVYLYHTDPTGDVVIAEYAVIAADGGATIDAGSRRVLLTVPHREFANHNGGQLVLGPDGFLYAGVGDGGGSGDPGDNGQDTDELLGKILRIDPSAPTADRAYAVPADNPFAAGGGRPEIYLYGARNPWRFSFDRATGDLWVADVGQNEIEEVNLLAAPDGAGLGVNLGWNWREGDRPFRDGTPPEGLVDPIHTYDHRDGNCSVTGGYVYRGTAIPALQGVYLYGDYCVGEIRGLLVRDGVVLDDRALGAVLPDQALVSFGQGVDGELYVLSAGEGLFKVEAG